MCPLKREIEAFSNVVRSYFPEFLFPPPTGGLADFGHRGRAAATAGIRTYWTIRTYVACCGSGSQGEVAGEGDEALPRCSSETSARWA
ncbi:hypothetical protein ADL12_05350 [Streptomyces regalis]|uniref:Uncharacterized protein n=1 Tax=Streptomyces regalis TaxID=68262 RepID=A0A0X3VIH1_9ACTN|nr:hypothetical protein ADL12_05350 [Streptomyces regalis]